MTARNQPFLMTRGVVLAERDLTTWDWAEQAKAAGLTTLATHGSPSGIARFVKTEEGQAFLEACRDLDIAVEHELHAMAELLPRELFKKDPAMFRMNDAGHRVPDCNLCVHSEAALRVVCEHAGTYAGVLRPTTGRYFFWIDDGQPMCRCPQCRGLSDSDQALILENALLKALRQGDPRATVAHLVYMNTLKPPTQVKPQPGIFLEYAPYMRRYDVPFRHREARLDRPGVPSHGEQLDALDGNLELFGCEGAQALEYWLDVSRFARQQDQDLVRLPWDGQVFLDDLDLYASRGIRHVTSFAVKIHGDYVRRFGEPPLREYASGMLEWKRP